MNNQKIVACLQMVLLIGMSFSFAFILEESFVGFGSAEYMPYENGIQVDFKPTVPIPNRIVKPSTPAEIAALKAGLDAGTATSSFEYAPFGIDALKIGGKGGIFGSAAAGGMVAHLAQGAVWSATVVGAIQLAGSLFDLDEGLTNSLSYGAFGGIMAFKTISALGPTGLQVLPETMMAYGPWIGIGVGVAIFVLTYKEEKRELVKFECLPWEAPIGGQNCEQCNGDEFMPCSEYRCKSLGQACEIVNEGTDDEMCVWVNRDDTQKPVMTLWEEILNPEGLAYRPDNAISPPNTGTRIVMLGEPEGCLPAFTRFTFGFKTNEPAQCRVSFEPTDYDNMQPFGNSILFEEEHIQELKAPQMGGGDSEADEALEFGSDKTIQLYTRCIDANGNGEDSALFAFSFCVDDGPDTTPPTIERFSVVNEACVQYDVSTFENFEVFTNEPAECRWSVHDQAFDAMPNSMVCATSSYQVEPDLNFRCVGDLTGIENREDVTYYFRCKDFSEAGRNVMSESRRITLTGSESLILDSVGPTGEIKGSGDVVNVELTALTSHGCDEGSAICYISSTGEEGSFNPMFETGEHIHKQTLSLGSGTYNYHFKCIDDGSNSAEGSVTFTAVLDVEEPLVARAYRSGSDLNLITNEESACKYSLTSCNYNFADGLDVNTVDGYTHRVSWDAGVSYYIKCMDFQNRLPSPDACSIVAEGSDF